MAPGAQPRHGPRRAVRPRSATPHSSEHPNIVPIYDLTVEEGRPVLTMRVVRGRSLRQVMDAEEMPARTRRLDVFKKVCDAIAYAHSRGVVHRDLKADNIMVGAFGEVQVMDWGLAWRADEPETAGTIAGTPATMAPEQARGETHRIGPAVDVYALGVLLYELLCGIRAFRGTTPQVLEAVRANRFDPPRRHRRDLPHELEAIVLRAMSARPEDRFSTIAELRSEVETLEQGLPIESLTYSPWARLRLWLVRHRQRLVPVALTAGLAASLGVLGLARYATDLGIARDDAMAERDRAVDAERLALERVVEAQLAGARGRALARSADPLGRRPRPGCRAGPRHARGGPGPGLDCPPGPSPTSHVGRAFPGPRGHRRRAPPPGRRPRPALQPPPGERARRPRAGRRLPGRIPGRAPSLRGHVSGTARHRLGRRGRPRTPPRRRPRVSASGRRPGDGPLRGRAHLPGPGPRRPAAPGGPAGHGPVQRRARDHPQRDRQRRRLRPGRRGAGRGRARARAGRPGLAGRRVGNPGP
ncbi:MAG: protein kinase [Proteobacteria bacterium]|nr:protein kinase [Pseudomonadota bacterium]